MSRSATPWMILAGLVLAGMGLGSGIWLGRQQASRGPDDGRRRALERQLETLEQQQASGAAEPATQQRQLELLVALDRKAEATTLLEQMADRDPQRWQLRLLLAELRRDQGDLNGAAREARQLLNLQPEQIEALQLLSLLDRERGQTNQAIQRVQRVYARQTQPKTKPAALATGLLLAELLDQQGSTGQAEAVLIKLATAFPADQRPLLARALLLQQSGNVRGAQALLNQARALKPGSKDQTLDQVATAWGLAALKGPSGNPKSSGQPRRPRPESGSQTP